MYEQKWAELKSQQPQPPIASPAMPWPVFCPVSKPENITYEGVKAFILHPLRLRTSGGGSLRKSVMAELLRWHSDKFDQMALPKVRPGDRELAKNCAGVVVQWLTRLLAEV
ncbi:hypothetical protein C8Q72DRAFT_784959 [Fomitopsis betulina]|nr:hypothetical protein C8Q72DRAFT_784959 [Fomitopsis betulina]